MQRFITENYYVYCPTREDVLAFYELCQEYELHFTTRWRAEQEVRDYIDNATFVFNYDAVNANDGVSFWTHSPKGDKGRPVIRFDQLVQIKTDVPDILDLL